MIDPDNGEEVPVVFVITGGADVIADSVCVGTEKEIRLFIASRMNLNAPDGTEYTADDVYFEMSSDELRLDVPPIALMCGEAGYTSYYVQALRLWGKWAL